MNRKSIIGIAVAAVVYLVLFLLGASSGAIHPACYAYAGAALAIPFAFVYLYVATKMRHFGAAALLNGVVLVIGLIVGEGNPPLIIGMIVLAALAELFRFLCKYDTLKGVRVSFIPFAYSFFTYVAHWWTDTEGSLAAAVEEMPAGYDQLMIPVIQKHPRADCRIGADCDYCRVQYATCREGAA